MSQEIATVEQAPEAPGPNRAQRRARRFHRHGEGMNKTTAVRPAPVRVRR